MALFSLVDEDLEHGPHLGQLPARRGQFGLQLLRSVVHDCRDGVDGVVGRRPRRARPDGGADSR